MISFSCSCGRNLKTREDLVGRVLKCPGCGQEVAVPSPATLKVEPRSSAASEGAAPLPAEFAPRGESGRGRLLVKALAIVIVISVAMNLMFLTTRGTQPASAGEIEQLRRVTQERETENASLKESILQREAMFKDYFDRLKNLEGEHTNTRKELERVSRERDLLSSRLSETAANPAAPAPEATRPKEEPPRPVSAGPVAPKEQTLSDLVERHMSAVLLIRADKATGSGFFVTPGGLAITNYHVIKGSGKLIVERLVSEPNGKRKEIFHAQPYAVDVKNDLALIQATIEGSVPVLQARHSDGVRVGDPVFAIGNPGVGTTLLEMSVTSGIISSLPRQIDERRLLQTSTPINPGNSGGPLLTMEGKVVGVVTSKARGRENIGFAVPAEMALALLDARDGPDFRVTYPFSQWEATHAVPLRLGINKSTSIPVGTIVTRMLLEEELDRILALTIETNSLLVISLSKKEVLKTIFVGSEPSDLLRLPTSAKNHVWVCTRGSQSLVKVDLDKGVITETLNLSFAPVRLERSRNLIWCLSDVGRIHFVSVSDRKEILPPGTGWGMGGYGFPVLDLAFDTKRDRMLAKTGFALMDIDATRSINIIVEMNKNPGMKEAAALQQELGKYMKPYPQWRDADMTPFRVDPKTGRQVPGKALGFGLVIDEKATRFYTKRSGVSLDRPEAVLGTFKAGPHSLGAEPEIQDFLTRFSTVEEIIAASSNGKWVCSGTHLFSAERFTVHKELPVPTLVLAFSKDSKLVHFVDWVGLQIAVLEVE